MELDTSKITNLSAVEFTPLPSESDTLGDRSDGTMQLGWCPEGCFPPMVSPSSYSSLLCGAEGWRRQVQWVLGVCGCHPSTDGWELWREGEHQAGSPTYPEGL